LRLPTWVRLIVFFLSRGVFWDSLYIPDIPQVREQRFFLLDLPSRLRAYDFSVQSVSSPDTERFLSFRSFIPQPSLRALFFLPTLRAITCVPPPPNTDLRSVLFSLDDVRVLFVVHCHSTEIPLLSFVLSSRMSSDRPSVFASLPFSTTFCVRLPLILHRSVTFPSSRSAPLDLIHS